MNTENKPLTPMTNKEIIAIQDEVILRQLIIQKENEEEGTADFEASYAAGEYDFILVAMEQARADERAKMQMEIPKCLEDCRLSAEELAGIYVGYPYEHSDFSKGQELILAKVSRMLSEVKELPTDDQIKEWYDEWYLNNGTPIYIETAKWMRDQAAAVILNERGKTKKMYSRDQVVQIINDLLERPDILSDAIENENTDHTADSLLRMTEGYLCTKWDKEK